MNAMDQPLFLVRVLFLMIVLATGLWLIASGLQVIIGGPTNPTGPQILAFIAGLVLFFGGIMTGIVLLAPKRE